MIGGGGEAGHRALRESLGSYVLGHLSPRERSAVEAHLDGCPSCRAEVAGISPVVGPLGTVDPARLDVTPVPPPWLGERIVARAAAERPARPVRPASRRGVLVAAAAVVAAAVLGGGVGYVAGQGPGVPREPVEVLATGTAVQASATVVPHTWGVEITLVADGFDDGEAYRVVVIDESGTAVDAGRFIGTGPERMVCNLNTSVLRAQATGFDVLDGAGRVVLHGEL